MSLTKVSVGLADDLLRRLDERAARKGRSRSALIRDAIESFLHGEERDRITIEILEGHERIPQTDGDDPW
jgi:metal-responsive CopG/Arc/MetJ family transcriptional regulator